MVEMRLSSVGYYCCVTSYTYEVIQAIYNTCYCVVHQKSFNQPIRRTTEQQMRL